MVHGLNSNNIMQIFSRQLHLELSKVGWDLNHIYGLQITVSTVINIIFLILDSYYLFSEIINSKGYNFGNFYSLICTISSVLTRCARTVYLNNVCGRTVKEVKYLLNIITITNKI